MGRVGLAECGEFLYGKIVILKLNGKFAKVVRDGFCLRPIFSILAEMKFLYRVAILCNPLRALKMGHSRIT